MMDPAGERSSDPEPVGIHKKFKDKNIIIFVERNGYSSAYRKHQ